MSSDHVNNQIKPATEVEIMYDSTRSTISNEVAGYVAAMAENQAISLSQRVTELGASNNVSVVSSKFSVTDEHGRQIAASVSISFAQ